MGLGTSRPIFTNSHEAFTNSSEDILEVNFDELFLTSAFESDLVKQLEETNDSQEKTKSILSSNLIADLMLDPIAFTNLSNMETIWTQILSPMLGEFENSKPIRNRIFLAMQRYFNERPNQYIESEINRQHILEETTISHQQRIMRHFNQSFPPLKPVTKSLIESITSFDSIKQSALLPLLTTDFDKSNSFSYNPIHSELCLRFRQIFANLTSHQDIQTMLLYQMNLGFLSSDLSLILDSLLHIYKNLNNVSIDHLRIQIYPRLLSEYVNVQNSINFLSPNKYRSIGINQYKSDYSLPSNPSRSLITCDGYNIYLISSKKKLLSISLNKKVINPQIRFKSTDLVLKNEKDKTQIGVVACNNFLLFNSVFLSIPLIYSLPNLHQVTAKLPRILPNPPFTTDGQYIYSVDKRIKSIYVHALIEESQSVELILVKTISITYPNGRPEKKQQNQDFSIFTNGTVLTCILESSPNSNLIEYRLRHISLLDGHHIKDIQYSQKFDIASITYDPWNRCYWAISPSGDTTQLIKMSAPSAQPTWLYTDQLKIGKLSDITTDLVKNSKNPTSFYFNFFAYLEFIVNQLNGCSFESIEPALVTGFYSMSTTKFLCPCTQDLILLLIDHISFYLSVLDNNPKFESIVMTLMKLLDSNLMNIKFTTNKFTEIDKVVDLYLRIIGNNHYLFLRRQICFSFVNIYHCLPLNEQVQKLFQSIYYACTPSIFRFIFYQIDGTKNFPYLISPKSIRALFSDPLDDLISGTMIHNDQIDFMGTFMRTMMIELYQIYQQTQTDLPKTALYLRSDFIAFGNLMYEKLVTFLQLTENDYQDGKFKYHSFIKFLTKWMIWLEPFTQFSRLSIEFTGQIQLFYFGILNYLKTLIAKNQIEEKPVLVGKTQYKSIMMFFYEIFSLYLNFVGALIDGGTEMKEASQFLYLIESTKESKITPDIVNNLTLKLLNEQQTQKFLSRGFSFNIMDHDQYVKNQAIIFVKKLAQKNEALDIKALMDYLYSQGKKPQVMANKKLKEDQRWYERIILSAFCKQLGVVADLMEITVKIHDKQPVFISHFIKQIMDSIYQVRRDMKLCQQRTTVFHETYPNEASENLAENFNEYVSQIKQKAVFLLHIRPCLEFQSDNFEANFPKILQHLTAFISKAITINDYYKTYLSSLQIRGNIKTGVQLIHDFFNEENTFFVQSFMIDKLAKTDEFNNYLSNLDKSSLPQGISSIQHILNSLSNLVKTKAAIDYHSLIILYTNLIISLSKISVKDVYSPLMTLFDILNSISDQSYSALFYAFINVLLDKLSGFVQDEQFQHLINKLIVSNEVKPQNFSIQRIIYKITSKSSIDYDTILSFYSDCEPIYYHSIASYLYEKINDDENPTKVLLDIIFQIGQVASGNKSIAMSKFPRFTATLSKENNEIVAKSPELIISFADEMCQLIRKILVSSNPNKQKVIKIFDAILNNYHNEEHSDEIDFTIYPKEQMTFAIFAILSNQINVIHNNSLLSDGSSTYYIDSIDSYGSKPSFYKLPFSKSSQQISIKIAPTMKAISPMPFKPNMYTNYSLLIPIFINALTDTSIQSIYLLLLLSFNEYIKCPDFLIELMKYIKENSIDFNIKDFLFTDSSDIYLHLLKSYLMNEKGGFLHNPKSNQPKLNCISLYSSIPDDYTIQQNQTVFNSYIVKVLDNLHMFVSNSLSSSNTTTLTISIIQNKSSFSVGFYNFSTSETHSNDGMLQIAADSAKGKQIVLKYSPNTSKDSEMVESTIYLGEDLLLSETFCDLQIGFLLVFDSSAEFSYSFSTQMDQTDSSIDESRLPLIGKAILRKQNPNKFDVFNQETTKNTINHISSLPNNNLVTILGNTEYDASHLVTTSNQLNETITFNLVDAGPHDNLMQYPNTPPFTSISLTVRPIDYSEVDLNISVPHINVGKENIPIPHPGIPYFYLRPDSFYSYYAPTKEDSTFVSPFTGTIHKVFQPQECAPSIPLITSRQFEILPDELSHLYTPSYINSIRIETLTSLFINLVINQTVPVDAALSLFIKDGIMLNRLVQIVIRLLVLLEPISFINSSKSPVDFSYNVFEKPAKHPKYYSHLLLLQTIFDYLTKNNLLIEFISEWFTVLTNQFNDPYSHSCHWPHPKAYVASKHAPVNREYPLNVAVKIGFYRYLSENLFILLFKGIKTNEKYAVIPYIQNQNETFFGTFLELVLSFKYFCLVLSQNSNSVADLKKYRISITQKVFDSINAHSPFFYTYTSNIFNFLNDYLTIISNDIEGSFIQSLNILALCNTDNKVVQSYLVDQEILYQEKVLLALKSFFPEFLTNADKLQLKEEGNVSQLTWFDIPVLLPNSLISSDEYPALVSNLNRFLKFDQSKEKVGFPFHFFINDWREFTSYAPPFTTRVVDPTIIEITYESYIPTQFSLMFKLLADSHRISDYSIHYSTDLNEWRPITISSYDLTCKPQPTFDQKHFYLRAINPNITNNSHFSYLSFIITSPDKIDENSFLNYRTSFTEDMCKLIQDGLSSNARIFHIIEDSQLDFKVKLLKINPMKELRHFIKNQSITIQNDSFSTNLLMIRYKVIVIINYLYLIDNIKVDDQTSLFKSYISPRIKSSLFMDAVSQHSIQDDSDRPNIRLNRKAAGYIRLGMSDNLDNSIIGQMVSKYRCTSDFRIQSDRPWQVQFADEEGIDVGGLARELANELAADFMDPLCGLCVKTPNGVFNIGANRDCVIPFPNHRITNYKERYKVAGASIAISIRTGLVQHYTFPPFFWNYMVTGHFQGIEDIYSIDKNYQNLMTSILQSLHDNLTEEEFQSRFNLRFVIMNSAGEEVPLTTRGKEEVVMLSNAKQFINLANDYRLNELKEYLDAIKEGIWDNFNFAVPDYLDPYTLEYSACGDKEITVAALRKIVRFSSSVLETQIEFFWRVVEAYTPQQRSLLLKFATSSVNIPPNTPFEFKVDDVDLRDTLPTASTCFNCLHLPVYSTFEKAYKYITIAIEFTDSFEKG